MTVRITNLDLMRGEKCFRLILALGIIFSLFGTIFVLKPANAIAASVTTAQDILSTSATSASAQQEISFITPTGVALNATLTLTWESGYTLPTDNILNSDLAFSSGGTCSGFTEQTLAASPSTTSWGVVSTPASRLLTFTAPSSSNNVPANRCIRIKFGTNASQGGSGVANATNPSSNGDYTVTIGGSFGDSGVIAVNIVADDSIDVTATVSTSIACTVDNTSTAFGTFTVATVTTASPTVTWTVSTNAANGYNLTVRDVGNGAGTAGLYSSGAAYNIASATADLGATSIGYGLQGTKTNGDAGSATSTIQSPYTATGTNVGALTTTSTPPVASLSQATGPVANATVTSTLKAIVSGLVPAGSYVDTLTYICTGIY